MAEDMDTGRIRFGVLSAFCASLLGIGLARFAYTPLLPALIGAHWFPAAAAAYLGAANLAGYLAGAMLGQHFARLVSTPVTLRAMMVVATLSFFACAWPAAFMWFFIWRFVSGLAGGVLMVLAAPAVLAHVPHARRGVAGGFIFMGIGVGVAASGTLVPLLLEGGLSMAWLGLGGLAAVLTLLAWQGWPADAHAHLAEPATRQPTAQGRLRALYVSYGLVAVGLVPHMLFLVDFVARGLGRGLHAGAGYWVLFGLGAMAGPLLNGHLADRIGFAPALRLGFAAGSVAVLLPAFAAAPVALGISSLIAGACTPGLVPIVLGRVHELRPHDPAGQRLAWSRATIAFALFQAVAAYGLSFLFAQGSGYNALFMTGAAALALALMIDGAASAPVRKDNILRQER